jgi:xylan 1,4-beta-xylosidase
MKKLNTRGPSDIRHVSSRHVLSAVAMGLVALTSTHAASAIDYTLTVDAGRQVSGNPHFWSAAFGTGKAKLALRSDWQTHYKISNRELGALRVRGHGLLNDEMGLYKGVGSYDWTNLDTYLSAISTANMRPMIELDFMPTALGTSGDKSPPKDYAAWNDFIKALVQHCIDKYGASDVANWYFEVWNEPDYSGFWLNTDMNAYYTLYDNTANAITAVVPNALVGGPATTGNGPIAAFLQHTKSSGARVAFVSNHNYPGGSATGTAADANSLVGDNNYRVGAIISAGYSTADVKSFNTEWNSSYSGQGGQVGNATLSMDNHWNVGFILKGVKLLADKNSADTPAIDVFSYWVLTDVFDEDGGTDGIHMTSKSNGNTPFDGVFGVMTFQGMRKAAFNAFKLLNYTGPKRVAVTGGTVGTDGVDAMVTESASGDELQILVYNYYKTLNTASSPADNVTVNVSNLPTALAGKSVSVTQFLVDETHSNPYNVWAGQGKPASPTEAQWQAMRAAQHLALAQPVAKQTVTTSFSTTFSLNKQAGTLILVGVNRPVTGRNALVELEGEDYDGQSSATKEDSGDTSMGQSISIDSGGYIFYYNVDFSDVGVDSVQFRVKTSSDTTLELHQDSQTGSQLGTCNISSTGSSWATQTCSLSQTNGVHDLYVIPGAALHLNWMQFQQATAGGQTGTGGAGNGGATGGDTGGMGGTASAGGDNGTGGVAANVGGVSSNGSSNSGSCSCRIGNQTSSGRLFALLFGAVLALRRRRGRCNDTLCPRTLGVSKVN